MNKPISLHRIVLPGLLGNILEWYDFALYGYFAATITPLFFPNDNATLALLTTYAVFAVGFIMRPLGAVIFGYIGDNYGRKTALSSAILLMAIPTTVIGLLPDYHQIGLAAPLLLILCRLLQGLAVGGEFTGSIVYLLEHAPADKGTYYGSLAMASAFFGLLLGSATAAVTDYFTAPWAWRVPFLFSLFLGVIGLYLRHHMPESPVFAELLADKKAHGITFTHLFNHHLTTMIKAIGLVMLPSTGFYLSFLYLATYLYHFYHIQLPHTLTINTVTLAVIILCCPLIGYSADKIGRYRVLMIGALAFMLLSTPLYYWLGHSTTSAILIAQILFAVMVTLSYAVIPAVLMALFPPALRYTGLSLTYNLANALFGGTSAFVATTLVHYTGVLIMPGVYLSLLAAVTLGVILWQRRADKSPA